MLLFLFFHHHLEFHLLDQKSQSFFAFAFTTTGFLLSRFLKTCKIISASYSGTFIYEKSLKISIFPAFFIGISHSVQIKFKRLPGLTIPLLFHLATKSLISELEES